MTLFDGRNLASNDMPSAADKLGVSESVIDIVRNTQATTSQANPGQLGSSLEIGWCFGAPRPSCHRPRLDSLEDGA